MKAVIRAVRKRQSWDLQDVSSALKLSSLHTGASSSFQLSLRVKNCQRAQIWNEAEGPLLPGAK